MDILFISVTVLITAGIIVGITGLFTAFRYKEWQVVGLVASIVGLILIMLGSFIVVYTNQPERSLSTIEEEENNDETSEEIFTKEIYPFFLKMSERTEALWASHWTESWEKYEVKEVTATEMTATLHTIDRAYEQILHELHGERQEMLERLKEPFSLRVCDLYDTFQEIILTRQEAVQIMLPVLRKGATEQEYNNINDVLEKEKQAIERWEKYEKEVALLARATPRTKRLFQETPPFTIELPTREESF